MTSGLKGRAWRSIVAEGRYEELLDRIDYERGRDHAWLELSKHIDWWEPGALKPVTPALASHSPHLFFRVVIEQLSGREAKANGAPN
jgi:uncharacterized protein